MMACCNSACNPLCPVCCAQACSRSRKLKRRSHKQVKTCRRPASPMRRAVSADAASSAGSTDAGAARHSDTCAKADVGDKAPQYKVRCRSCVLLLIQEEHKANQLQSGLYKCQAASALLSINCQFECIFSMVIALQLSAPCAKDTDCAPGASTVPGLPRQPSVASPKPLHPCRAHDAF